MTAASIDVDIKHFHLYCGLGGAAKGFNKGNARVGALNAKFRCIGGIDVDAASIRDFTAASGVRGTVLDLFDTAQYLAFYGAPPPAGWREASPDDIRRAAGGEFPNIVFLSAPCKGFSGLLAEAQSKTDKYQALNGLTLRGVWLMLEAFKDDLPEFIVFENVPRIANRGRYLLDQIVALYRSYGYAISETTHDCGQLGGLGQSRKRFLLVGRNTNKIPAKLYVHEPKKQRLRGVGEILEALPLPGTAGAGPMHRMPALQWKTWVRLAFVEAGSDWRSLNKLNVADGVLSDFGIVPEWEDTAGAVTTQRSPGSSAQSVADPRIDGHEKSVQLGVGRWDEPARVVKGDVSVGTGKYAVPDPRHAGRPLFNNVFRIVRWDEPAPAVAGPGGAANGVSVADPRPGYGPNTHTSIFRTVAWDGPAGAVTGADHVTGGGGAVADPRLGWNQDAAHPSKLKVKGWDETADTVSGARFLSGMGAVADPRPGKPSEDLQGNWHVADYDTPSRAIVGNRKSGAAAVADPRPTDPGGYKQTKYRVTSMDEASGAVIAASTTGNGAFAVADPRPLREPHDGNSGVHRWEDPSGTVQGASLPSNGAFAVADPRAGLDPDRQDYKTGGHYGVVPWDKTTRAVPGFAKHDRGPFSVADPRDAVSFPPIQDGEISIALPAADQRLVCVIRALDNTWHRPFTTLELAALQSLVDPDEVGSWGLDGVSDSAWRERIGNAVPPNAAAAIAGVFGRTLLLAMSGETFVLGEEPIWVQPIAMALAIDHSPNEGLLD